ncbi:hypothetical protein X546_09520 [Brevibacillus borstelensis cifa_chp40]|nr:hypothetical protein X546_09520 [Brevibacillus borstelensis cifa_chp40]
MTESEDVQVKRHIWTVIASLALIVGAGCSKEENALPSGSPIEVALTIEPQEVVANEAVTFSIKVTQDGAPVDDARETEFEIWKDGQEQHETIPATLQKEGVYTAQKTFAEPGAYNVMYHVTARDFHNMQTQTFTVKGAADQADGSHAAHEHDQASQPEHSAAHEHGSSHGSEEHHHGAVVNMHFQPAESIKANEAASLTVHVQKDNQALTEAAVKFEIWREGEEKHQYVDASEKQPGEYTTANATFPASGTYTVKVHVEKGEIHDHKEFSVTVQ